MNKSLIWLTVCVMPKVPLWSWHTNRKERIRKSPVSRSWSLVEHPKSLRWWWQKVANSPHGRSFSLEGLNLCPRFLARSSLFEVPPRSNRASQPWAPGILAEKFMFCNFTALSCSAHLLTASHTLALLDWCPPSFWLCGSTSLGIGPISLRSAAGLHGQAPWWWQPVRPSLVPFFQVWPHL